MSMTIIERNIKISLFVVMLEMRLAAASMTPSVAAAQENMPAIETTNMTTAEEITVSTKA